MSILNYFARAAHSSTLPDPDGDLSERVSRRAILSANRQVEKVLEVKRRTKRRGKYNTYSKELRTEIGWKASRIGVKSTAARFTRRLGKKVNESTVRSMLKAYKQKEGRLTRKRKVQNKPLKSLPPKKRGKPLLLGEKIDMAVQQYIRNLCERGTAVTALVVQAAAEGILLALDSTRLAENGGHVKLTNTWAKSLLSRMNFTKRKGSTKQKVTIKDFEVVKIPSRLIFNWDQTGLNLVPCPTWTMEEKGKKRVEIAGLNDKRQITTVLCGNLDGEVLPVQLIYGGKTKRCHALYNFPDDWNITHSANHWSNENTMIEYIEEVIVPYVESVRQELQVSQQAAMAIFDNFKGQITKKVLDELEQNNIQSVLIPVNCTDRLQPMDLSVNKSIKTFLRKQFTTWYAKQVSQQVQDGNEAVQASSQAQQQKEMHTSKNTESNSEESDETWRSDSSDDDVSCEESKSSDDERDDEDSTGSSSDSSDEDTRAEFEPVDTSAARMKSLGGKWLVDAINYLESHPAILTNGFKAAGITDALGITVDLTNEIENYTESESDDEYEELLHVDRCCGTLNVRDVYSDEDDNTDNTVTSDEESPDTVIISDDE